MSFDILTECRWACTNWAKEGYYTSSNGKEAYTGSACSSNCSNQEPFSLNNLLFSIDLKIYYALPWIRNLKFLKKKKKKKNEFIRRDLGMWFLYYYFIKVESAALDEIKYCDAHL
jgi:hypothetical protein